MKTVRTRHIKKKMKNAISASDIGNINRSTKSEYEEPLSFDFLTKQNYKEYDDFVNFCETNFAYIDMREVNNVISEMKKNNVSYLANCLSSSSEEEADDTGKSKEVREVGKINETVEASEPIPGDDATCFQEKKKTYRKNLKLVNIRKSKRARVNMIVIKKKYIDEKDCGEEKEKKNTVIISPIFMPVGTKCCIKGLVKEEVKEICNYIILSNTYHISNIYDMSTFKNNRDINNFLKFPNAMLTDSGGFQMVSLSKRIKIMEEGILFNNIYDSSIIKGNIKYFGGFNEEGNAHTEGRNAHAEERNAHTEGRNAHAEGRNAHAEERNAHTEEGQGENILLSPEMSIRLQNIIGSDIIMALDDVRSAMETDVQKIEEAMYRTNRWLRRCIESHEKKDEQSLFGIIQGGLNIHFRNKSMEFILNQKLNGYAIGGLCGGEKKKKFIHIINHCSNENNSKYNYLPVNKCRYIMGIGYIIDILFCSLFGYDMYDCVYPSRTARFNTALSYDGTIKLKQAKYKYDFTPIVKNCTCYVCSHYSKASLHILISKRNPIVNILLTIHNIFFTLHFCHLMRVSIFSNKIELFTTTVLYNHFVIGHKNGNYKIPDTDEETSNAEKNKNHDVRNISDLPMNNYSPSVESKREKNISPPRNIPQNANNSNEKEFTNNHMKNEENLIKASETNPFSSSYQTSEKEKMILKLKESLPQWALEALEYADIELKF
ncbi:queuine tRNA-ribosyltransferase, putative [Plasmodium ovale wallikeri]|uniref:Queuine tRNA-ribosyltransferase, putative n=1 Tax=Plasmodium ovale wallikeri TaxID=864142 RepID=A0A1A8YI56_PLAOA|nr:queuine tRNA-ribosyltransferase, putative [Plasmodium ovale wallikeri]